MESNAIPTTLGSESIGKLLKSYAIPAIIAMTAQSLYNMVDSIFIGHGVGPLAISGLAITFPLMNLAGAFGSLVGVGASSLISIKLGQKDYETARKVLGNVLLLNIVIGLSFSVITLAFLDPIIMFFGASADTLPYARDYMEIILIGNMITHIYLGLNAVLRASGNPKASMIATIIAVLFNTVLDPVFIYGFHLGIRGAAYATVLAQIIALLWQLKFFTKGNQLLCITRDIFHFNRRIIGGIIGIGLSPFLMNMASCLVVTFMNQGLKTYGGDLAIGAFGIVNRISFLFLMVVMGLNQGMQPIAGYNYGAGKIERVKKVFRLTALCATIVTSIGFLIGEFTPRLIVRLFTDDNELLNLAVYGMRVVMCTFPLVGVQIVISNLFQSIGMAKKSIFLSLSRQLIFLLPSVLILPHWFGITGVWTSMPVSDTAASIISTIMILQLFNKWNKHPEQYNNQAL
ncbi:MAG: MATE family efflux transporter [Bacteroidales bacterium]|nr:MATE family efflux transporter [Bacteroidales bacterium]